MGGGAEKLKIGVVGAGAMGRNHLRAARTCDGVALIAVADIDAERATGAADEFGCGVLDPGALIGQIHAAIIAAPTANHRALTEPLLRAGIHCLVEKPLAPAEDDCRALLTAARAGNATLQVGHIERFNSAVEVLLAARPSPSDVRKITARRLNPSSARVKDIGVIEDLMVHDLDVILALKAGIGVSHVSGRGNADEARAIITFVDGCVAMATASRKAKERARDLDVVLAAGFMRLDYIERWVQISRQDEATEGLSTVRPAVPEGDAIAKQLDDFVAAIKDKRPPRVGGADALAVMRLAWQIQGEMTAPS